jgi:hypothetical protein
MKEGAEEARRGKERDEGWDETVLVWNATVAKIPVPPIRPDPRRPRGRASSPRADSKR